MQHHRNTKKPLPYPYAHYYILALLILTVIGFWESYFGDLMEASVADHLHGITATCWIVLMAAQSWLIHHGNPAQHRSWGKALFIIVPLMTGAFALVTLVGALKSVAGHPFYQEIGQALLTVDVLLLLVTPALVFLALKVRRNVHLHSALMFSTLTGLMPPALSRLFANYVPALSINSLDELYKFKTSLQISVAISIIIALILYFRHRKHGWPWLLSAGISVLSYVLFATLGQTTIWNAVVKVLASAPAFIAFSMGTLFGVFAVLAGWQSGKTRTHDTPHVTPAT